jgi:pyrroline-5-carboxylate reductase
MASSLAKGLLTNYPNRKVYAFDPYPPPNAGSKQVEMLKSNSAIAQKVPKVLFLGTKPQYIVDVCKQLKESLDVEKTIVVSLAAGMPLATMEAALPAGTKLVRCMPNIPCTVQAMASGVCGGKNATKEDVDYICKLLSALGTCLSLPSEELMHAVTGVSGSGPAYIFMIIEALADGGVRNGLPRATALELAMHTVKGAAEMFIQTKTHPAVLKDQVCSPGGTTIAAVDMLEKKGVRSAMIDAVTAASNRSRELSKL